MIKSLFKHPLFFVLCLGLTVAMFGQESIEGAAGKEKDKPFELNEYVRGTLFVGKTPDKDETEIKKGYSEVAFNVGTRKLDFEKHKYRLIHMILINKQNDRKSVLKVNGLRFSTDVKDEYFTIRYLERF